MPAKRDRRLRIGVLGAGPIAQAAHLESCTKAANADLYAICDVAPDLLQRMAAAHGAERTFADYDAMLADPEVEAVIVATSDAFHVPAATRALDAGKHVLCEKPLGVSVEEVRALREAAAGSGLKVAVGHMKRFDPGLQAARAFVQGEIGEVLAYKGWYCDSTHRYAVTDAVQPLIVKSAQARRPAEDPKANLRRYHMLAHGSHLIDTARFLCGDIVAVTARLRERFGARCWFVDAEFASGALGHLDLTVAVRMDWHEGCQLYGENGSVLARTYNPWLFKSSDVDIFREADASTHRPLGADAHVYRRQVEAFADWVLTGEDGGIATADDGLASVRGMVAIARSAEVGHRMVLAEMEGPV